MITSWNGKDRIFYQAQGFTTDVAVTGYLVYPDATTSPIYTFTELGDGIYYLDVIHEKREGFQMIDKYGIVIKEGVITTKFDTIHVRNG